jgi:hypothetical protein
MYFDDCERMTGELGDWERSVSSILGGDPDRLSAWTASRSEDKRRAIDRLLGYNARSASALSDGQVEEETLRWAVDTNLVWTGGEDEEDDAGTRNFSRDRQFPAKYDRIKDLRVASSCNTLVESLAYLWDVLADVLEQERTESSPPSSAGAGSRTGSALHLIVFPKSKPLWDYDTMVTLLQAIQISKPLLPSELELRIDLFHPDYKHSPKMWSPETHSPFPTVGLSILKKTIGSVEEIDFDVIREKLNALMQSGDATRELARTYVGEDLEQALDEARSWYILQQQTQTKVEWTLQTHDRPSQLYKTLWNAVLRMTRDRNASSVIVAPSFDSHTLHRVAVTVNSALKRLDIPVRIARVYRPQAKRSLPSTSSLASSTPYGMIQLSPLEK